MPDCDNGATCEHAGCEVVTEIVLLDCEVVKACYMWCGPHWQAALQGQRLRQEYGGVRRWSVHLRGDLSVCRPYHPWLCCFLALQEQLSATPSRGAAAPCCFGWEG